MRRLGADLEEKQEPRVASFAEAQKGDSVTSSGQGLTRAAIEKRPCPALIGLPKRVETGHSSLRRARMDQETPWPTTYPNDPWLNEWIEVDRLPVPGPAVGTRMNLSPGSRSLARGLIDLKFGSCVLLGKEAPGR